MLELEELYDMERVALVHEMVAMETGLRLNQLMMTCIKSINPQIDDLEDLAKQQEVLMNMFINVLRKKDKEISANSVKKMKEMMGV